MEIYPIEEINDCPERFATDPDQIGAMRERAREFWRARWFLVEANVNLGLRGVDAGGGIDLPSDRLERWFDRLPESSVG